MELVEKITSDVHFVLKFNERELKYIKHLVGKSNSGVAKDFGLEYRDTQDLYDGLLTAVES